MHRPFDVRVFHRQARTLAEAGHRVLLLAHADFNQEQRNGVTVKGIPRPANRFFRLLSIFRFARRCLQEKADVYHFHDLELLPVGVFLKWLTGKPVIYDCHENYPEAAYERAWYPDWFKPWVSRFIGFIEPLLARQLDWVICVVPDQQQRFDSHGCRTALVRNLPRLELFDKAFQQNKTKLDRLIYVGGLTLVRGAKILVDIMVEIKKTHPQVRLLCLGPFNEPQVEQQVKQYMRDKKVADVIDHLPFVAHERVADYIVQSRIGLIPWQPNEQMLRMVFPNKVFEYMACGIPVVASDLPSLRYIFGQAQSAIVVPAEDVMAHVNAIRELLSDEEKRQQLGKRGRQFVHDKFNWNTEAEKLLTIYESYIKEDR